MPGDRLHHPTGFSDAYRLHYRSVLATVSAVVKDRQLAEDVTQEVFVWLWRRPASFDAQRGDLGLFLRLLARSRAVDAWRSTRSRAHAHGRFEAAARVDASTADDAPREVERRAEATEVRGALGQLPPAQQQALALAYWGGLTTSEIAERLSIPVGTVKSRVRLGLQHLRSQDLHTDGAVV